MTSLGFHYDFIDFIIIIQCQYAIVPFCVTLSSVEASEVEERGARGNDVPRLNVAKITFLSEHSSFSAYAPRP